MKLIHLSDLHLGKRVNEYSMLEDQRHILAAIVGIIKDESPNGVILAGDIYDKAVPPAEAVGLFDDFLVTVSALAPVFVISGNHDSPERIAFASRIMEHGGIYLSPVYDGEAKRVTLRDGYGEADIWLLPFIKPAHVRRAFPGEEINSYTDAVRAAVGHMDIDPSRRNVLVTHQFVTGASRSDSEEISVGGADNVDAAVFEAFDYVALGHIHSPQNCGARIRYCGTPLKYSFSEAKDVKSVTVAELGEKGSLTLRTVPLSPLRDMVELRGSYAELTSRAFYAGTSWQEDYTHITLTDEDDVPEALGKLRAVYHNLMKLDYDNSRTRTNSEIKADAGAERKSPAELFSDFYTLQNNGGMSAEQEEYMLRLIEKTWEAEA